jgi:O-antigen/teichoic acid export membrane protein
VNKALITTLAWRLWSAAASVLIIPFYVQKLGIEGFAFIAFFIGFQTIVTTLDLGLPATLTRLLAAGNNDRDQINSANYCRTSELIYLVLTVLLIIPTVILLTWYLTSSTFNSDSSGVLVQPLDVAVVCVGVFLSWPIGLYNAALVGLQRQSVLALTGIAFTTIRLLVTYFALSGANPKLSIVFELQLLINFLWLAVLNRLVSKAIYVGNSAVFDAALIKKTRTFTGHIALIGVVAVLLTQLDKIVLVNTLEVADYGVYALAVSAASCISLVAGALFPFFYPRFSYAYSQQDALRLAALFRQSTQGMAAFVIPLACSVAMFSNEILFAWTGNAPLSARAAPILEILCVASAINAVLIVPYALQLACGLTKLPLVMNFAALILSVPTLVLMTKYYGPIGAALSWFLVNVFFAIIWPALMHKKLLPSEKQMWYYGGVLLPWCTSIFSIGGIRYFYQSSNKPLIDIIVMVIAWLIGILCVALILPNIRNYVFNMVLRKLN